MKRNLLKKRNIFYAIFRNSILDDFNKNKQTNKRTIGISWRICNPSPGPMCCTWL